jgi:NAD(P)H-hydrate epimerase
MSYPRLNSRDVAWISTEQMIEIDRIMIEDLGITLLQMMENAGRSLADLAVGLFSPSTATVLAGPGGNGGGGLTAARHLHNLGINVGVTLTGDRLGEAAHHQAHALRQMGVPFTSNPNLEAGVVIDAMVGYSLTGALHGLAAELAASLAGATVLSLDVPSGLDASSSDSAGSSVSATATMTLCLPKTGLRSSNATGDLYLADISVPSSAVAQVSNDPPPPFQLGRILQIV